MSDPIATPGPAMARDPRYRALRGLAAGSAVASCGALAVALFALARAPGAATATAAPAMPARLDELTVGRLNVVEPDGTPRMIVASRARFPGSFVRGKEIARPDRSEAAGILFVNDEGTENGGLIQAGQLGKDGKARADAGLTFDRFRQDQMVRLGLGEDGDETEAGLWIDDRPSYQQFSIDDLMRVSAEVQQLAPDQRAAAIQHHRELGHRGHPRGYFGTREGVAQLVLDDPQGRPRLVLRVSPQGEPSIALLDEAGKPVRTVDLHTP